MIRVTIEMVPMGMELRKRHMATIEIENDLDDTLRSKGRLGSYIGHFSRISQQGQKLGDYPRIGRASGIRRNESGAVYRILHKVLDDFLYPMDSENRRREGENGQR